MSYFFDRIMNESYTYNNSSLTSGDLYKIDSIITDDPITMYNYTSECINNIYKTDAAFSKFESMNIVSLIEAKSVGDNYRIQQISVAMEGAFGDMVEKIKEWISKAYNAIKNFLKKCWNKIKTRFDIIRGQIGRYEDVLKNRDLKGCKIKWIDYAPENVFSEWESFNKTFQEKVRKIVKQIQEASDYSKFKKGIVVLIGDENYSEANISKRINKAGLAKSQEVNDDGKPKEQDVEFDDKKDTIFKYVGKNPMEEFNKLSLSGENALKEAEKELDEAGKAISSMKSELSKSDDDSFKYKGYDEVRNEKGEVVNRVANKKDGSFKEKAEVIFNTLKNAHTFKVGIYRRFSARLNEVLNANTAQCAAACKKAIVFAHENNREQKEETKPDNSSYIFNVSSFNDMLNYV